MDVAETGDAVGMGAHVGASLRGRPNVVHEHPNVVHERPHTIYRCSQKYGFHNKKYNATIGYVMNWFKTMITNEYIRGVKTLNRKPFNGKLWQRNYWYTVKGHNL
jgi:hypothetical protein